MSTTMRESDQFATAGEDAERHVKMVCAVWQMTPRRHVFIGAATVEALQLVWKEITGVALQTDVVQAVRVSAEQSR